MLGVLAAGLCALLASGAGAASAQAACGATWTGAVSSDWGTAGNWSPADIPGINGDTADVCLPSGGAHYPVTYAPFVAYVPGPGDRAFAQIDINSLTIAGGAGLTIRGAATQTGPATGGAQVLLQVDQGGSIAPGGSLQLLATDDGSNGGSGPLDHGGRAVLNGGGTLVNAGSFTSASTSAQDADQAHENELGITMRDVAGSSGAVPSGTLQIDLANQVTNESTWTVGAGGRTLLEYNGFNQAHSTATRFVNDGLYVNQGTTVVQQRDHAQVGDTAGNPIVWSQQGGSVTGNAVELTDGAELLDAAGPGAFRFDSHEGQMSGTIPPGQTVTVEGDPYGSNAYQDVVTLLGDGVVNQGTLLLRTPPIDTADTGTSDTVLTGARLLNQGTLRSTSEKAGISNELDVALTNAAGGTVEVASGQLVATAGQAVVNDGTISVAPSATLWAQANPFLTGPETFTNAADGTLVPQVAADGSFGTFLLGPQLTATLGGTVAPALAAGSHPAQGTSLAVFPIRGAVTVAGTFAAVTGGFRADYSRATGSAPNAIALVYGPPAAGPAPGPGPAPAPGATPAPAPGATPTGTVSAHKPTVSGSALRLRLACSAAGPCPTTTVRATVVEVLRGKRVASLRAARARTKRVVVASSSATLAAGASSVLTLKLDAMGRALLERFHALKLTVTITTGSAVRATYRATVRTPKPR